MKGCFLQWWIKGDGVERVSTTKKVIRIFGVESSESRENTTICDRWLKKRSLELLEIKWKFSGEFGSKKWRRKYFGRNVQSWICLKTCSGRLSREAAGSIVQDPMKAKASVLAIEILPLETKRSPNQFESRGRRHGYLGEETVRRIALNCLLRYFHFLSSVHTAWMGWWNAVTATKWPTTGYVACGSRIGMMQLDEILDGKQIITLTSDLIYWPTVVESCA